MIQKILVIENPVSGKRKNKINFKKMIKKLKNNKYEIYLKNTTDKIGADQIIKNQKESYDAIFVCGGDGTLNQVITEISINSSKKRPIIYMPLGTTNDFAKSLKIKKNKIKFINESEYEIKQCDTGKVNENQFFNYIAACGVFTRTSYSTSIKAKRIFGRMAYIINGIKEIFSIREYETKVTLNDEIIEDKYIYIGVSNSYSIGGFKLFKNDEMNLTDGKFEVLLIKKPKKIIEFIKLGINLLLKKHNDKHIKFIQSSNIKIETKEDVNWTLDGEDSGKYHRINISNLNKNVEFLI